MHGIVASTLFELFNNISAVNTLQCSKCKIWSELVKRMQLSSYAGFYLYWNKFLRGSW